MLNASSSDGQARCSVLERMAFPIDKLTCDACLCMYSLGPGPFDITTTFYNIPLEQVTIHLTT